MFSLKTALGVLFVAVIVGEIVNIILESVGVQNPLITIPVDFLIGVLLAGAYVRVSRG